MTVPDVLALDFDGVCCDGLREYFETSRRVHARVWPAEPMPAPGLFEAFGSLRPVILSGWEMPVLLRAIAQGVPRAAVLGDWDGVRDAVVGADPRGAGLRSQLGQTLDAVRREWIARDLDGWLALHVPYVMLEHLRRLVGEPDRAVVVTTKEGEFARLILDRWRVTFADIEGKETGEHKCENLRGLIAAWAAAHGRRPRLAFVEDRLETLQHVTTHADLEDVALYLAEWGYNTDAARARARADGRIRLLALEQFRAGTAGWP
ncbi:MAG TPA: HAD family hydrolase [Methylomirabilota bacterium]|nr:HAD family hydrolase [Methylomirabilota bacterium]